MYILKFGHFYFLSIRFKSMHNRRIIFSEYFFWHFDIIREVKIASLKKQEVGFVEIGRETLELLLKAYFPGSKTLHLNVSRETGNLSGTFSELSNRLKNQSEIKWKVFRFCPYKAPVMDRIFAALLLQGFNLLASLCTLLRALGYSHMRWRKVKAVVIVKLACEIFVLSKSFRLIILIIRKNCQRL